MKNYTITEKTFNGANFVMLDPVTIEAKSKIAALRQFFGVEKPVEIMGGDAHGPLWADKKGRVRRKARISEGA